LGSSHAESGVLGTGPTVTEHFVAWLSVGGAGCWVVCFWWMYRISSRQDALLHELREQGQRIERLSKVEHDLIKEVHPTVQDIKQDVAQVAAAVTEESSRSK